VIDSDAFRYGFTHEGHKTATYYYHYY